MGCKLAYASRPLLQRCDRGSFCLAYACRPARSAYYSKICLFSLFFVESKLLGDSEPTVSFFDLGYEPDFLPAAFVAECELQMGSSAMHR
jgi:hypothetical protein